MEPLNIYQLCYTVYAATGTEYVELFYYAVSPTIAIAKGGQTIAAKYKCPVQLTSTIVIEIVVA